MEDIIALAFCAFGMAVLQWSYCHYKANLTPEELEKLKEEEKLLDQLPPF